MYPYFPGGKHPFHFSTIAKYQEDSPALMDKLNLTPDSLLPHPVRHSGTYYAIGRSPTRIGKYVYQTLCYPYSCNGTITSRAMPKDKIDSKIPFDSHFYHPKLRDAVRTEVNSCETCAKMKIAPRTPTVI